MSGASSERECFDAAVALKDEGRHVEAIAVIEAWGPPTTLRVGTRSLLGLLYGRVERFPDAIAILETVLADRPESYRASFGLLLAFAALEDAQRLRQEASRWMAARGERPPLGQKGHNLFQLYAKLLAAPDDDELRRIYDESKDEELD